MDHFKQTLKLFVVVRNVTLLGACSIAAPAPTATQTTEATAISTPEPTAPISASSQPAIQVAMTANPDQLARWKEYELALASKILFLHPPEEIICEWEILGQSEQELYVWGVCTGLPPTGMSEKYAPYAGLPAVIHLNSDGAVQSVELPRDGGLSYTEGIRKIFPKDVQEKIYGGLINYAALTDHAKSRRENPSPPLVVLLSTP